MEKVVVKKLENTPVNSRVVLDNRNKFSVTGVTKVISVSEQNIVAEVGKTRMYIAGSVLHVSKLDVDAGIIEGDGWVDSIKYNKKENLFTKMFK